MVSVSAEIPAILSLPWELLHPTAKGGAFVFQHDPPISICRRFEGTEGAIDSFVAKRKGSLRVLFIVSRPEGASFINPRSEAEAVMDALEQHAPGRVEVEFLRPPTFKALRERLSRTPSIDVIHSDGHGSYENLAQGSGVGASLEAARWALLEDRDRHTVRRGTEYAPLELHDWFLPAIYQAGADNPLLKKSVVKGERPEARQARTNLPEALEAGFFGRRRELWDIERWFAGPTKRITVTGFGGQGKTALAQEAGRWLTRTGLFQAAVFVDYSQVQGRDAVAVAVSNMGSVLEESLIDGAAAADALAWTPTLVILDNLEALEPDALRALLDAAVPWSDAGGSRVLCTTRKPDFGHGEYKIEDTLIHRR